MSNISKKYGLLLLIFSISCVSFAQKIDYTLQEVQVQANLQEYYDEDTRREELDSVLLSRAAFLSLGDVLRMQGGLLVSSYGSRGSIEGIKIRGTGGNHTSFLWNGIPVNSLTTGSMDASLIPAGFMEAISLTRGASGAMAGSSSFGGAVNMENSAKWKQGTSASLLTELGSFGYRAVMPSVNLSSKKVQYKAQFQILTSDNDFRFYDTFKAGAPLVNQINDTLEQWGLMQNLYFRFKANTEVDIGLWLQNKNKDIPAVMGSYMAAQANQTDKSAKSYIKLTRSFGVSRLLLQAAYLTDSLHYTFIEPGNSESYLIDSRIKTRSFFTRAEWRWFVNQKITVDFGAHSEHPAAIVDAYGTEKRENRASIITAAKFRHRSWIANLGLRKEFNPYKPPKPLASLGLSWKSKNRMSMIRGNISNKFRIPSFNERYWQPGGNPELLPESGWGGEIGWRFTKKINEIFESQIEPVLYYQKIGNWIQWVPGEGYWLPQNQELMLSKGIEISGLSQLKPGNWNVRWNYKYSYTDAVQSELDKPGETSAVIYIPKHQVFTGLIVVFKKVSAGINYQYMNRRYTTKDQDPLFALSDLHLVNFNASLKKQVNRFDVDFYIRLNNLLNTQYQMIRSYASPGLSGILGMKVSLNKT